MKVREKKLKFKSGSAIVEMRFVKEDKEYFHYNFQITIEDDADNHFIAENYTCPKHWSHEKIASDMISWALDLADEEDYKLFNAVIFDESIANEDVVLIESEIK